MIEFKKKCSGCGNPQQYKSQYILEVSIKNNTLCGSCAKKGKNHPMYGKVGSMRGKHHSKESKLKMSESRTGEKNHNYGKKFSEETKRKMSENDNRKYWLGKSRSEETKRKIGDAQRAEKHYMCGKTHSDETLQKMSEVKQGENNYMYGKQHSTESKRKMRQSRINEITEKYGTMFPNYNPEACKIIDQYAYDHHYNFQHAENGGEYHIKDLGYWVDGYDKDRNVVIEYYEKAHKYKVDRDEQRRQEIIDYLGCEFIIINE